MPNDATHKPLPDVFSPRLRERLIQLQAELSGEPSQPQTVLDRSSGTERFGQDKAYVHAP